MNQREGMSTIRAQSEPAPEEVVPGRIVVKPKEYPVVQFDRKTVEQISRRVYGDLLGAQIAQLFGSTLSKKDYDYFQNVLDYVGPSLIQQALNSYLFTSVDELILDDYQDRQDRKHKRQSNPLLRSLRRSLLGIDIHQVRMQIPEEEHRSIVARRANQIADRLVNESGNLLLHDVIHNACAIDRQGQPRPDFYLNGNTNDYSLLEEEAMAVAVGQFANNLAPIPFALVDSARAASQTRELKRLQNELKDQIKSLERELRRVRQEDSNAPENIQKRRALRALRQTNEEYAARIRVYTEAGRLTRKAGGISLEDMTRLFFDEVANTFKPVQLQQTERLLRLRYGNNLTDDALQIHLLKTEKDFDELMVRMRKSPPPRLIDRLERILTEYPKNPKASRVLFEIWKEMIQPLAKAAEAGGIDLNSPRRSTTGSRRAS